MRNRDVIEQIEYNGYKINIYQDEFYESPSDWGDNECFLVHYHRDCWITNKLIDEDDIREWYRGSKSLEKEYWVFPVAAYIHGGVSLSLGSGRNFPDYNWDVSHVGAVLVKRNRRLRKKTAYKYAEGIIETWNDYLSGNVYGYMIEDSEGNEEGGCWNYYGDWETSGILDEAKAEINGMIHKRIQEAIRDNKEQLEINENVQPTEAY